MTQEDKKINKKIRFTETVLRDGQQSLMATRMKTEDMLPIIEQMDAVGYESVECWGGATFDVCMRYLDENPWERLRTLKKNFKNTKLQMLLRGQNLLGYRHYADDVVDSFIERSADNGIDVFRIFDAFNDLRNLERSAYAVKKTGAHLQLAMAYTVGEAYTDSYWSKLAKDMEEMGADSIGIKDMAGLLDPVSAERLIKNLKEAVSVPLQLHSHCTSGFAVGTYIKAIEAGCDIIDTAISPFSMGTSQPATEVMNEIVKKMTGEEVLNDEALTAVGEHFKGVRVAAEEQGLINIRTMDVDTDVLKYQIPGGMLSNLLSQMKEQKIEDRFGDVVREIPKVREELGEPPLVTPSSQIVGTQAVFNVVLGERYKMVSKQAKDILRGKYGRTIRPFDEDVRKKAIGDDPVITCRPADELPPEMETTKEKYPSLTNEEDLLSYILFPNIVNPEPDK